MVPNEEIFETLENYIDGALDQAGRAQVETQLAQNPQLRKLVAELLVTRNMLRELPRASAPPEMAETFQGSLERSALLEDDGPTGSDVLLRINRWPQFMSAAAILLLAIGLAAVIYKVILPQKSPKTVASNTTVATSEPTGDGVTPRGDATAKSDESVTPETRRSMSPSGGGAGGGARGGLDVGDRGYAAKSPAKPADVTTFSSKAGPGITITGGTVADPSMKSLSENGKIAANAAPNSAAVDGSARPLATPEELQKAQTQMTREGKLLPNDLAAGLEGAQVQQGQQLAAGEPLVLLVQSQDPRQANEDVARYLSTNHIAYVALGDNTNPDNPNSPKPTGGVDDSNYALKQQPAPTALNGGRLTDNNVAGNSSGSQPSVGNRAGGDNADQRSAPMQQAGATARNVGVNDANNIDRAANFANPDNGKNVVQQQEARGVGVAQNAPSASQQQMPQAPAQTQSNFNGASNNLSLGTTSASVTGNGPTFNGNFGAGATSNGGASLRANAYRTVLTRRQIQQLNDQIARRGNQWTEVRNEAAEGLGARPENGNNLADGVAASTAPAGKSAIAADQRMPSREREAPTAPAPSTPSLTNPQVAAGEESRKVPEIAPRNKDTDVSGMKAKAAAADQVAQQDKAPATQPAVPGVLASDPAEKGATSGPAVAEAAAPTPAPVTLKKSETESPSAPTGPDNEWRAMQRREAQMDAAKAEARELERPSLLAAALPTTQPTTMPSQLGGPDNFSKLKGDLQLDQKVTAEDTPRVVLIVVNDQPFNPPTLAEPTTRPAAEGRPAPTTAPAAKQDNGK